MSLLGKILPGVQHVHNLHPLTVHFPIAYLIGAAFLYLSCWIWPSDRRSWAAYWCLLLGFAAATFAVGTGFYALWKTTLTVTVRQHLLMPHMYLMIVTWLITNALTAWAMLDKPFPRAGRRVFLLGFLVLFGVITFGIDFGSRLVYDYNAAGNAIQQPKPYSK